MSLSPEPSSSAFRARLRRLESLTWGIIGWLILAMVLTGALNTLLGFVAKHEGLNAALGAVFGEKWSSNLNPLNELQWYLFSIVFLLGGAFLIRQDGHVRVDVVYERLARRSRRRIDTLGTLLLLLPWAGFIFYLSLTPVWKDFLLRRTSDSTWMPHWFIQLFIPIGFGLLFLTALWQVAKQLQARHADKKDADGS